MTIIVYDNNIINPKIGNLYFIKDNLFKNQGSSDFLYQKKIESYYYNMPETIGIFLAPTQLHLDYNPGYKFKMFIFLVKNKIIYIRSSDVSLHEINGKK